MIYWMIFGMFVVTYVPRMLPLVLTKDLHFPPIVEKWLSFIPYAALGALIFPGVMTVTAEAPWIGFVAAACTFLVAWYIRQMIVVLISSVVFLFILQFAFL
jgi:branched-subunit amino acid transport protein